MTNKELHGSDEWNKTCWRLGFGSTIDHDQKSCTIFKIANNGGGEWRENDRVAFNLPWEQFLFKQKHCRSIACAVLNSYLVPQVEIQLFKQILHKVYCISYLKGCIAQKSNSLCSIEGFIFINDQLKCITNILWPHTEYRFNLFFKCIKSNRSH